MAKPEHMTSLRGAQMVEKTHPVIRLRGQLDALQAAVLLAKLRAQEKNREEAVAALGEIDALIAQIFNAEYKEEPLPPFVLMGMDAAQLRAASHNPEAFYGIPHVQPCAEMGRLCLELNALRAQARAAELCAVEAFGATERPDILKALNRLSSAIYLLTLREMPPGQWRRRC
ncbi:MAG: hypothetical protein LBC83_05930 [Oscillospiraceae bacterium]|jgi:ethanolamine utilization cobalamin adenosyltransferase|nr:hypothetical protein [Oscillospiraceae bacterium]